MTWKILVVDDEAALLDLMTDKLTQNGFSVVQACDGLMGVQRAHSEKPDLIVLDLKMPAGGGLKVFEDLKSSTLTANIPIIFVTAYMDDTTKNKLLARGATLHFLEKPINTGTLIQKIESVLQNQKV
jgi:CheY-like chemotaxis protein